MRYLDMFNLNVFTGEIMGIFFVDHHGKQAFIDVLTEQIPIDYGDLFINEELVRTYLFSKPRQNRSAALISPYTALVDDMSVADNVFVMRKYFRKFVIDASVLSEQFASLASEFGLVIDGRAPAGSLSMEERYLIQLLKAAVTGYSLILLCDISGTLEAEGLDRLHRFARKLTERDITFLIIENRYRDLFAISDRLALVEKGRVQQVLARSEYDDGYFGQYYFDTTNYTVVSEGGNDDILRFRNLTYGNLKHVSFTISEGESILFWDQSDTALRDMVDLFTGAAIPWEGDILFTARPLKNLKPLPIGVIDEVPSANMVFPDMSYMDNLCFLAGQRNPDIWLNPALTRNIRNEYHPLTGDDIDAPNVVGLSRSSLYKLVYYRQQIYSPRLLVLVKPFRDTDRRLKQSLVSIISSMREKGTAILFLDVNVTECAAFADRTLVFNSDRQVNEVKASELRQEREE